MQNADFPSASICPPICCGDLVEKEVGKSMHAGENTAAVKVCVQVCLRCKERQCSQETVRRFELIKAKLERQENEEFRDIGVSYQVAQFKKRSTDLFL